MQDLWRVKSSGVSLHDLDDPVDYHRFLNRFKEAEQVRKQKDLLYEGKRFGTLVGDLDES
ncbi:MAG TPA: hypothetical protein VJ910_04480 [Desulfuromonadales bacterium]|nr:hypothetical protein [Desulfuromonadales bacterium]